MDNETRSGPRNILPDCMIPVMAVCFAIYYLTTITEVPWISQASAIVVSMLLFLSVLAFVVRSTLRIRRGEEKLHLALPGTGAWASGHGDTFWINMKRLALLVLTIGYVWIIDSWGFTITTFVFILLGILLLSSLANWKRALLVALSCSVVGYIVFIHFFQTRFPRGPIENWLKAFAS